MRNSGRTDIYSQVWLKFGVVSFLLVSFHGVLFSLINTVSSFVV